LSVSASGEPTPTAPLSGSHLYTTNPENPEPVGVRPGTLDQDPGVRPGFHQFVDYAPPWAPVPDDGLTRFPERAA
jgi:hypothetical protein